MNANAHADRLTRTHGNEDLSAAVHDLDVLVVHEAAHDGDVGVALGGVDPPRSLRHLPPHTARPVFAPPGVMGGDIKCQQVTVLQREKENMIMMTLNIGRGLSELTAS